MVKAAEPVLAQKNNEDYASRCTSLDDVILNPLELAKSLFTNSCIIQSDFGVAWTHHAEALVSAMERYQPPWSTKKQTILKEDAVCRALVSNTVGYQQTGPLTTKAKAMHKLMKKLCPDGGNCAAPVMFPA